MSNSYDNQATSGRDDAYTSGRGTEANYSGESTGHHHGHHHGQSGQQQGQDQSSYGQSGQQYEQGQSGQQYGQDQSFNYGSGQATEHRGDGILHEGSRAGGDFSSTSTGGIPKVHEGHVSAGSQLVSGDQGFTGVDMAAETAKFDNAFGAVPTHQESFQSGGSQSYGSSGNTGASYGSSGNTGSGSYGTSGQTETYGSSGNTGSGSYGATGNTESYGSSGTSGAYGSSDNTRSYDQSSTSGSGFQQSTGGAYQGSTGQDAAGIHGSHHGSHHHGSHSEHSGGNDSYTGSKDEQKRQMKEEKKEEAAEKKEELKHRNNNGESKMDIAKDEHRKIANEADEDTADGKKPGLMDKIKTAVKKL